MSVITVPFTLLYNGVEKSLAAWGIDDLEYEWENIAVHKVHFTVAGRAIDASNIFPWGATVIVYQGRTTSDGVIFTGGKRWFYGRVAPWDLVGGGGREDQTGLLVNPWDWLENIQYQMIYTQTNNGVQVQRKTNRVVLGILFNQTTAQPIPITTGQQIIAALQWAISQGAPIQIGNIAPWIYLPSDFQKSITCAEVLLKIWRLESDFVVVWDYTTLPYPTIHCLKGNTFNLDPSLTPTQKSALVLTPLNIDLNAGNWLDKVHIRPRPDWQKSFVNIDYDQINTEGTSQYLALGNDHYPDPLPTDAESLRRGVNLYFDLAGSKVASSTEYALITSAPFDITSLEQWQVWKKSELTGPHILNASIILADTVQKTTAKLPAPVIESLEVDASGNPVAYNPANAYELIDGHHHDWMVKNNSPVTAEKVRVTAYFLISHKKGSLEPKLYTKEFTAISANTANVSTPFSVTTQNIQAYAEAQPVGLAKVMYQAWQSLAAEGTITSIEQELSGLVSFANCLNFLTQAQPGWASLNAVVQSISGSANHGVTNVKFGAPLHLTAAQLINFTHVSRFRIPSVDIAFLFGGALSNGGGTVRHPRKSHSHASDGTPVGAAIITAAVSYNPPGEASVNNQGVIKLDATPSANGIAETTPRTITTALADLDTADKKQAKMQIWSMSVNGQQKKIAVLATDVPDAGGTGGGNVWL